MNIVSINKTDNIQIRIQKPLKERVEAVLDELGLTTSQAIILFFKQIIDKNGLPFPISLDYDPIPLSDEELSMIKKSIKNKKVSVNMKNEGELDHYLNSLDNKDV